MELKYLLRFGRFAHIYFLKKLLNIIKWYELVGSTWKFQMVVWSSSFSSSLCFSLLKRIGLMSVFWSFKASMVKKLYEWDLFLFQNSSQLQVIELWGKTSPFISMNFKSCVVFSLHWTCSPSYRNEARILHHLRGTHDILCKKRWTYRDYHY